MRLHRNSLLSAHRRLRQAPRLRRYRDRQIPHRHQLAEPHTADYWNEHRENFAKMLKELMLEETLKSVLGEASKTSLKWNHVKVSRARFFELLICSENCRS